MGAVVSNDSDQPQVSGHRILEHVDLARLTEYQDPGTREVHGMGVDFLG